MSGKYFNTESTLRYFDNQPPLIKFWMALAVVVVAALSTHYIPPVREHAVFLLYFFAIIQTSFWLGRMSGLLVTVFSMTAVNAQILLPLWHSKPADALVLNLGFSIFSLLIIATTGFHRNLRLSLLANQQDLNHAQAIGQIGSWRLNVLRNELSWSEENYRIFGVPKGVTLTYETFLNTVHPDDRGYVDAKWQAALLGQPYDIEHRIIVGGKQKWLRERAELEFGKDGKLVGGFGITKDITASKAATAAIQDREQKLQLIMDATSALIAYLDTDCKVVHANKTFEDWFELAQHKILGREVRAIIGETAWAVVQPFFQTALAGEIVKIDHKIPHDGKNPRWVNVTLFPDQDATGHVKGIVAHIFDIEYRKRAEEALKKNQNQLLLFIEQVPFCIAMFDRDMNYLVTSRLWHEKFCAGFDDLTDRNHYEVNPDLPDAWKAVHQKALAGECLSKEEDLWVKADGSRQWYRWAAYPWKDEEDKIGGIIIYSEDITARRNAEEQLQDTQTRFNLVIKQVQASYWDWDLKSGEIYSSPEWNQQIGFDDNNQMNNWDSWEGRLHPDDKDRVLEATEQCTSGRQSSLEYQYRIQHKDGSYRWIHSRGALLCDALGQPARLLGINLDITDYIQAQKLNKQHEEMEKSTRHFIAGQTAAAIAHDLNQPLTAIAYYAFVAQNLVKSGNPNPQRLVQAVNKCEEQSQRAGEVIHQLLDLLHKGEIETEPVDLNKIAIYTLDYVKTNGQISKNISTEINLTAGLPPVICNTMQAQKVLINLVSNGLEAIKESNREHGILKISTRGSPNDPACAWVSVSDNGIGAPEGESLEKLFNPFYSTKSKGLGMGLAISRSLIEAHNGKMWAEQNADNGLTIHFTLPFVAP